MIDGTYFEDLAGDLVEMALHEAKEEHRRASVRAAVKRLRDRRKQPQEQTEQAA